MTAQPTRANLGLHSASRAACQETAEEIVMTEFLHPRDHRADGSAYGRPAQHPNALWAEVGPGKPMGELLRRYWHPIALSEQITDLPRAVRILGEDLVLFRDGKGR